jgi:hypothetical protein
MSTKTETLEKVNVAKKSTNGHYVVKHKKVVCLNEIKEAFFVNGEAELETINHKTLPMEKDCLIMPQQVYNPYSKSLERSRD